MRLHAAFLIFQRYCTRYPARTRLTIISQKAGSSVL